MSDEPQRMVPYSSVGVTLAHSRRVGELLADIIGELAGRSVRHDLSKTMPPEVEVFDVYTPKLEEVPYGSEQYMKYLEEMAPALQHHYAHNRHHTEHFADGVDGMNLVDVLEMLADWVDRIRQKGGNLEALRAPQKRFGISDQLMQLMVNTARDFDMFDQGSGQDALR